MADPVHVVVHSSDQLLEIGWSDGYTSRFPFLNLRKACPCVYCKGGHAQMSLPLDPAVFAVPEKGTKTIVDIKPTGTYAIQIVWSDGHNSGLYRWDNLRKWAEFLPETHHGLTV